MKDFPGANPKTYLTTPRLEGAPQAVFGLRDVPASSILIRHLCAVFQEHIFRLAFARDDSDKMSFDNIRVELAGKQG